jgi:cardiolipin synthase
VSQLAKWKTTFQMVALGALILRGAWPDFAIPLTFGLVNPTTVGFGALWLAAALTVVTGWDYLRVGLKHMD